ncbi:hypothetical protein MMC07_006217 [Pseudocyphellaria aurata]|nr:hypothetical protein [Pseudocyphellaria aurata]
MSPSFFLVPLISVVFLALARASELASAGSTITLNGIPYYVPGTPFASRPNFQAHTLGNKTTVLGGLVPITVVTTSSVNFNLVDLQTTIKGFKESDDVWQTGFLSAVYIEVHGPGLYSVFPKSARLLGAVASITSTRVSSGSSKFPPGPYFISPTGDLYQPYRLYGDISGDFTQPLAPAAEAVEGESYVALPVTVPGIDSPGVAVPSRLYYTKTAKKPLAGVRIAIKDIYDIAGVRTSDGNRAFYGLYPPKTENSVPVQRLIDAGAVLVGKIKTSQFANGEVATADWVDYHAPFNPRGDGYQDPSSSSSGAGSAIASYPWLDLALGSDTGGSVRGPSQVSGVYGNRPSHGLVPLTGVMPLAPQLDTAGFLTRDPIIWADAAKVLYAGLPFYKKYPKKLQTISFPIPGIVSTNPVKAESDAIVLSFLAKLEGFLSTKATALNYTALWDTTKPDPNLPSLAILLNRTYPTLISKEETKNVRDPFFADYAAAHDGRRPFIDPVPLVRWAFGDSLPASELDVAVANKTLFKNWWETHIVSNDSITCSDTLFVYTSGVNILYRNLYGPGPSPPFGFGDDQISIYAEIPDMVVPLGDAAYNSTVTLHSEVLPVSVDLMAAKGCDGMIFQLVEDLYAAGIVSKPQAGGTTKGGEILLRRNSM